LTANRVNGRGNGERSGAQTLALLAAPLNTLILRALADGPRQQVDLRGEAGSPAQTTLRAHLKKLAQIGAIEKHRRNRFPGVLEHELTEPGRDLLLVVDTLERWLGLATGGPLAVDSNAAKVAIKALAEGWSTTMLRALAAGALSLTELDKVIGSLSYPSLERRLAAMRLAGQVEACSGDGGAIPYAVTEWLRLGVAPLVAAARWERRYLAPATPRLAPLDCEAIFLLAAPLLRLPTELSGACRFAMEISNGERRRLAGATVEAQGGRVVSCVTQLQVSVDAWALGPPTAWLDAVIDSDSSGVELGGDQRLAGAVLDGLHEALAGVPIRKRP
jgi:DNA-binding HxlR family transcriptional regulator